MPNPQPVTAFAVVVGASQLAKVDRSDHEQLELATAQLANQLLEADANAKRIVQLTEELRVADEQRAYYEQATEELLKDCKGVGLSIQNALAIPVPESIEPSVGTIFANAPGDPAPGSNGKDSSPPDEPENTQQPG